MDTSKLQDCISLYGADLAGWPKNIVAQIKDDERATTRLNELLKEELQFEEMLLSGRFEMHDSHLVQNIIGSALGQRVAQESVVETKTESTNWLQYFFVRPAFSMAATLIVGLLLGYSFPLVQESAIEESFDDYSTLLYDQDEIL